jgi:hypothetical protein
MGGMMKNTYLYIAGFALAALLSAGIFIMSNYPNMNFVSQYLIGPALFMIFIYNGVFKGIVGLELYVCGLVFIYYSVIINGILSSIKNKKWVIVVIILICMAIINIASAYYFDQHWFIRIE